MMEDTHDGIHDVREFEDIINFIRGLGSNYDCDSDGHRDGGLNTGCRSCQAAEFYRKLCGEDGCKEGNPCYRTGCIACFVRGSISFLPGRERICIKEHRNGVTQ